MTLEKELAFYRAQREQWIRDGQLEQWCVVRGEELVGFYGTFEEAYAEGLTRFGAESFLVKQVLRTEPTERILHVWPE